jgi:hypothetical protein
VASTESDGTLITSYFDGDWTGLPRGLVNMIIRLDPDDDPTSPTLAVTKFPPNVVLPRHAHPSPFVDAVVAGSILIEGEEHHVGTVRRLAGGVVYGPVQSGPDGCTLLEFYAHEDGRWADIDPADYVDEHGVLMAPPEGAFR